MRGTYLGGYEDILSADKGGMYINDFFSKSKKYVSQE